MKSQETASIEALAMDDPEDIDFCLHCPYIDCSNCLSPYGSGNTLDKFQKKPPDISKFTSDREKTLFKLYCDGCFDDEIGKAMGLAKTRVFDLRKKMGLPAFPKEDREFRKNLVVLWLQRK